MNVHSRSAQHEMRGQSPVNATRGADQMDKPVPESTPPSMSLKSKATFSVCACDAQFPLGRRHA